MKAGERSYRAKTLLPYTETNFTVGNEWYRVRHYPDGVWEIVDSDGFSIAHGKGYQS